MSRIGKEPIALPDGVTVTVTPEFITVKGPKGELQEPNNSMVTVTVEEGQVTVSVDQPEVKAYRSMWGTYASLVGNMVVGVTEGYSKGLEINGVGYGFQASGKKLTVKAGYSHPVEMEIPEGLECSVEGNVLTVAGINKQRVGEFAANVRKVRKPEPYKGTGIKYVGEEIIRKAGKQAVGGE